MKARASLHFKHAKNVMHVMNIVATEFMRHTFPLRQKPQETWTSRLYPEEGKELTNPVDIFSLPQYIWVMVSNYQPLQTVFSISETEYRTRQMKPDEQFSPTVTIVDAATQQPLNCVLLLHGEKPPEVTCRTLFCYKQFKLQMMIHMVLIFTLCTMWKANHAGKANCYLLSVFTSLVQLVTFTCQ